MNKVNQPSIVGVTIHPAVLDHHRHRLMWEIRKTQLKIRKMRRILLRRRYGWLAGSIMGLFV